MASAEIERTRTVRVPRVLATGEVEGAAYLALEWLEATRHTSDSARRLGAALAALHEVTAPRYGFRQDNTIGRTPQLNGWMDDWPAFFRERRLRPQLERAVASGNGELLEEPGARLLGAVERVVGIPPGWY